ncbi:MAG: vitamin K epoxide reductase family protein [Candidatus Paceibacterota bacterium]|jgi:uncharacterized membrane protein
MKHLKHLLRQPLQKVPNSIAIFLIVIALIGFVDAGYLTVEHFQGKIPPCTISGGCEVVLTSPYSVILGIPVSLAGVIYYLLILVGVSAFLESKNLSILKWTMLFTAFGLGASLWFVYIQVFTLHSYCQYCLVSAFTSIILFATSMEVIKKYQIKQL